MISIHADLIDLADLIRRALYLIETPFMTFPKFVVGSTNEHNGVWELPKHRPEGLRKRPKSSVKGAAAAAALSFFSEEDAA